MLKEILSKETCATCRFCCSFRRKSLWEMPLLTKNFIETHKYDEFSNEIEYKRVENENECYQVNLVNKYKTSEEDEEGACPFLGEKGCLLTKDKPFDCSIWPLRVMKKEDEIFICLTPTCPSINLLPVEKIKTVLKNGLGEKIKEFTQKNPYIIKEYRDGFIILDSWA